MWKTTWNQIYHESFFESHVESLCKKASQKVNAFSQVASSLKSEQRRILLNTITLSQLLYPFVV